MNASCLKTLSFSNCIVSIRDVSAKNVVVSEFFLAGRGVRCWFVSSINSSHVPIKGPTGLDTSNESERIFLRLCSYKKF